MRLNKRKLKGLIEYSDERNASGFYSEDDVIGVSTDKRMIPTKADLNGVNIRNYKLFPPHSFAYVADTSRRGDKIALAYNDTDKTFIVSTWYVVFRISEEGKNVILPDFLFMYFNRTEFDRYARANSWGSAREYFWFDDMEDISMEIPSIPIQERYVATFRAMIENQKNYERGLNDLRVVCDGYIESLRTNMSSEKIAPYIRPCNEKNENNEVSLFQGVTVDHVFTDPKRIAENSENGSVVRTGQFAFNKVMKAHNTKLPIALREGPDCVVSNSYQVFEVVDTKKLLPKYLLLWMNRSETQRYAGFISFGTTRDIFTFEDLGEISIPIPDLSIQQSIVDIFSIYQMRQKINEDLKSHIKNICPYLIKGAIEEAMLEDSL